LLTAFTDTQPSLSLAALAEAVRLNRTTTYRLATALEQAGLITRDGATEAYQLGPEAIALGGRALRANPLTALARPELERLSQVSGETATLEVPVAGDMLIVGEVIGTRLLGAAPSLGTRWPMIATSTGKAILASLPDDACPPSPYRAFTAHTLAGPGPLRRALATIRRQGYAVNRDELELGFTALGVAVHDHAGQPVAALSLGGPTVRMTRVRIRELAPAVSEAAGRVSRALGAYTGERGRGVTSHRGSHTRLSNA
jgi:IclR family acetate operon transcriptional repressor